MEYEIVARVVFGAVMLFFALMLSVEKIYTKHPDQDFSPLIVLCLGAGGTAMILFSFL